MPAKGFCPPLLRWLALFWAVSPCPPLRPPSVSRLFLSFGVVLPQIRLLFCAVLRRVSSVSGGLGQVGVILVGATCPQRCLFGVFFRFWAFRWLLGGGLLVRLAQVARRCHGQVFHGFAGFRAWSGAFLSQIVWPARLIFGLALSKIRVHLPLPMLRWL